MGDSLDSFGNALFRRITGKRWDDFARLPNLEAADALLSANLTTAYSPVRVLGETQDGIPVVLSEEDKTSGHIHIMAAPDQGKSSLIELLVRGDLERGYGACVIDPGERGDTALRLLKYCCSIGFEKVLYISPSQFHRSVPTIHPLRQGQLYTAPIGGLQDTLSVLWGTKDIETPRIKRYLPAMLHALYAAGLTLAELKWFSVRDKGLFRSVQDRILSHLSPDSPDRNYLEEALTGNLQAWRDLQSTVNRMNAFSTDPFLRRFVGSKRPGIDWNYLIKDGWLILVNLDAQRIWEADTMNARLIGTLVINEITRAISAIFRGSQGARLKPFYMYLDEAGQFMTPKIADILRLKRKTPLKFALAHIDFDLFPDRNTISAVRTAAIHKFLFKTPNTDDRRVMMHDMGYGGDLPEHQVMYTLGEMQKQSASVRIGGRRPVIATITDVPAPEVSRSELIAFMEQLYSYEWFHPAAEIDQEIDARFAVTQVESTLSRTRRPHDKANMGGARVKPRAGKDSQGARARTPSHNNPGSQVVLRRGTKRTAGKILFD